eukprot:TRINITY_DN16924_c0_g1_i1.p1 TRINITY_DN16924_c0_g1~~TRINITY_DN16924_c0_g1_i1.p1  ORF type:complete len:544 (+),score=74.75 TRINITY_DN16924_c0_g1_i1:139-1770(+)
MSMQRHSVAWRRTLTRVHRRLSSPPSLPHHKSATHISPPQIPSSCSPRVNWSLSTTRYNRTACARSFSSLSQTLAPFSAHPAHQPSYNFVARSGPSDPEDTAKSKDANPANEIGDDQRLGDFGIGSHEMQGEVGFYDQAVEEYARLQPRLMSMKYVLSFFENIDSARVLRSARFLQIELLVRMARPLRAMLCLPHIVAINPHIKQVLELYWDSFRLLREHTEIRTLEHEHGYTDLLKRLVDRHADDINLMSRGIREIRLLPHTVHVDFSSLDRFLDTFLYERISRRMLAEQHMAMSRQYSNLTNEAETNEKDGNDSSSTNDDWRGIVNLRCSPHSMIKRNMARAKEACDATFGFSPNYEVVGDVDTMMAYVPAHMNYILFEVFKNSLRAVVEKHMDAAQLEIEPSEALPTVMVRICRGIDVNICVSDQGGGLTPLELEQVFGYGYSSVGAKHEGMRTLGQYGGAGQLDVSNSPMAGLGYGLPVARLYARYMSGDVQLVSMQGFGTDAYIRLKPIADQTEHDFDSIAPVHSSLHGSAYTSPYTA